MPIDTRLGGGHSEEPFGPAEEASRSDVRFEINQNCVACLACVRACPAYAIAVEGPSVWIVDEACVLSGMCVPACPHDAIDVRGDLERASELAESGEAILILTVEAGVHFYPSTPEQVINACYRAGFRAVHHGVLGDELVAAEYLRLWSDPNWGTLIRSTCRVVVEKIRHEYPELIPYLAPVTTPLAAEVAYLREVYGDGTPMVYAGVCLAESDGVVDATLTFHDLAALLEGKGLGVTEEPLHYRRIPEERRRHMSTAGGLPLPLLEGEPQASRRFRKLRGLGALDSIRQAVVKDGIDLGFVDLLPCEGCLDHPLLGSDRSLFWRRRVVEEAEPPRSQLPVLDPAVMVQVAKTFAFPLNGDRPPDEEIAAVVRQIGSAPNGAPWDCGACGYETCSRFAAALLNGRATFRQCPPYQERRAEEAQREAAVDDLTGIATYRVLKDRLANEIARSGRSGETFAVLFIDLDGFKAINDTYGHRSGSAVLAAVGQVLQGAVRTTDVAGRYGGDEFVIVLIRTDVLGATRVAELIRARVEGVGKGMGYPPGAVAASIGVAEFNPAAGNGADVLERADRALYRAKAQGGNCVA